MSNRINEITSCEVCGAKNIQSVLDLGKHPMCDDLIPVGDSRICSEYPIEILFCSNCKTAHQRFQVPKEDLSLFLGISLIPRTEQMNKKVRLFAD